MWPVSGYLRRYTYLHRYRCLEVRKVIDTIEIIMITAEYILWDIMGSPSYLTTFMIMNYMPRALWYNLWLYFTTEKAIDDK